jgi:transcriptional antiterminator RfaH
MLSGSEKEVLALRRNGRPVKTADTVASASAGSSVSRAIPFVDSMGATGEPGPTGAVRLSEELQQHRWYVVHTQPRGEARAVAHLERQGFRTFCPCTRKVVRHARKQSTALAPLFPNYLFVQLDLKHDQWRSVNGTRGVVRLIANGDEPAAVPQGVVETLQKRMKADGAIDWTLSFAVGDRVKIADGPFASLLGTLEHLDASGRVRVLLELLGRSVCVTLRGDALLPAA